jgi:hypothetical protein
MTKDLYPAPARIKITCNVTSIKNGARYQSTEIGTNSMRNASAEYKDKIANAKLSAIYKHMSRGGGSDASVIVEDWDIAYFNDKIKLQRKTEDYEYKTGTRKRTFVWGVDKQTGKSVYRKRLLKKAQDKDFI